MTDKYTDMDRAALDAVAAEYELETDGMDDDSVRSELRATDELADADAEYEARQKIAHEAEGHIDESQHPMLAGKRQAVEVTIPFQDLPKGGKDGSCPHCGVGTGYKEHGVTEYGEMSPGSQRDTVQQFTCNECAGEWGPVVDKPKPARATSGSSNGLKIEKDRETQNGVTRPSIGGKCRGVWDMLDSIGADATAKQAREAAVGKFDKTTTMVQFYRWRKFNGISGK